MVIKRNEKTGKQVEENPQEIQDLFDGGYDVQTKEAGVGICVYYKKGNTITEFVAMHT